MAQSQPRRGDPITAQGETLGYVLMRAIALKGRSILVGIDRTPFQGLSSPLCITQGFTLDAKRVTNVCIALCVLTLGCDGIAPSGLSLISTSNIGWSA